MTIKRDRDKENQGKYIVGDKRTERTRGQEYGEDGETKRRDGKTVRT